MLITSLKLLLLELPSDLVTYCVNKETYILLYHQFVFKIFWKIDSIIIGFLINILLYMFKNIMPRKHPQTH